ncbi:MAG: hypothetical protein WBR15_02125 [Gammaproteobacteria bacterium]
MFKTIGKSVWAFDLEWVPDPLAAKRLGLVDEGASDAEAIKALWIRTGVTESDPQPFVKTVLSRIVSISAVKRETLDNGTVTLSLTSMPRPGDEMDEKSLLSSFFTAIGRTKPQLVGFNSGSSDLKILTQRGIALGISAPGFGQRPNKPWEGYDYWAAHGSEGHIDLADIVGGWGKAMPSLHEIAVVSGIPGKLGIGGDKVAPMYFAGDIAGIVAYNECDAITTYLLWLQVANFGGFFNAGQFLEEQRRVATLLLSQSREKPQLNNYIREWQRLGGYPS